jgi:hypothetical protein
MHVLLPPPATTGHRDHQRLTAAAHTALTGSVVLAGLLHLGWAEQVDPVAQTLSYYALHEGATRLFTACVGSAAAGSAALLAGLVRSRLPIGAAAPAVLGIGCAGLVVSAAFPTDPAGAVPSLSGLVHRHAAGAAVGALPAAGLLLAHRLHRHAPTRERGRRISRLSWASSAAALVFLGTHLSALRPVTPTTVRAARLLGLAERATLGLEVALLFAMADAMPAGRGATTGRRP